MTAEKGYYSLIQFCPDKHVKSSQVDVFAKEVEGEAHG